MRTTRKLPNIAEIAANKEYINSYTRVPLTCNFYIILKINKNIRRLAVLQVPFANATPAVSLLKLSICCVIESRLVVRPCN
jgi:hypothetical protein